MWVFRLSLSNRFWLAQLAPVKRHNLLPRTGLARYRTISCNLPYNLPYYLPSADRSHQIPRNDLPGSNPGVLWLNLSGAHRARSSRSPGCVTRRIGSAEDAAASLERSPILTAGTQSGHLKRTLRSGALGELLAGGRHLGAAHDVQQPGIHAGERLEGPGGRAEAAVRPA